MRSKLFMERAETVKTSKERWVRINPQDQDVYALYDLLNGISLGRILFDADENWIYDGQILDIEEQEEITGRITGNQKEMDQLLRSLME